MTCNGVMFSDKHSFYDFGLIMTDKKISSPTPQTKFVNVPGRDGSIDMSEVVGNGVRYEDRTINLQFYSPKKVDEWSVIISNLQNYLAGNKMQFIFDDDISFYWIGRVTNVSLNVLGSMAYINVTAIVNPYKYSLISNDEDWLWDPFDFEQSVINELSNILVVGEESVTIIGIKKPISPTIVSDSAMKVEYKGTQYNIKEGKQVVYGIVLTDETSTLVFKGNGTISIDYVGGSL